MLSNVVFEHFAITNCNIFIATAIGMEVLRIIISFCWPAKPTTNQAVDQRSENKQRYVCTWYSKQIMFIRNGCVCVCIYISNAVSFDPQKFFHAANGLHIHIHPAVAHNFYMIYTSLIPTPNCTSSYANINLIYCDERAAHAMHTHFMLPFKASQSSIFCLVSQQ